MSNLNQYLDQGEESMHSYEQWINAWNIEQIEKEINKKENSEITPVTDITACKYPLIGR